MRRLSIAVAVLLLAACGRGGQASTAASPGASPGSSAGGSESTAPSEPLDASASPTEREPVVLLACTDYLTPAEVAGATHMTSTTVTDGAAATTGEKVCIYQLGSGSLALSLYADADFAAFYEGSVAAMRSAQAVSGLGQQATYGDGPPTYASDTIAVLGGNATFTLYTPVPPRVGLPAMQSLAGTVVGRLK